MIDGGSDHGLSIAPQVLTCVMSKIAAYAHLKGIQLHIYLYDWLLRYLDPQQLQLNTKFMLELCAFLGLIVNFPKSNLIPDQEFVFLGILSDGTLHLSHRQTGGTDY